MRGTKNEDPFRRDRATSPHCRVASRGRHATNPQRWRLSLRPPQWRSFSFRLRFIDGVAGPPAAGFAKNEKGQWPARIKLVAEGDPVTPSKGRRKTEEYPCTADEPKAVPVGEGPAQRGKGSRVCAERPIILSYDNWSIAYETEKQNTCSDRDSLVKRPDASLSFSGKCILHITVS